MKSIIFLALILLYSTIKIKKKQLFDRLEELYLMEKMGIDPFASNEYKSFERKTYTLEEIPKKDTAVYYYEDQKTNTQYIETPVKVVPNIDASSTSKIEEANVSSEEENKNCKKADSKISFSNNNKITQMKILKNLNKAR